MAEPESEILYVEMSHMDYLLIMHVREIRKASGLTQLQLSQKMKLSDGFVSKVETLTERAKYSIRHLPLLAEAFNCSLSDLIPVEYPKFDMIRLTLERKRMLNKDGSLSKRGSTRLLFLESSPSH
ncbi:helix-turn-helix domain-containing protein [Marinilongibacter aquaticus]|uniref:helix-turn-helix domain-containing protein n=1 Tax=Marinilongibacter aquaticus TaxID=2975157 RepID=UPI0021BD6442|nr:helix-turn-helix transcriptional regulator [Marinilongibacter aquaticus]UBM58769.1 helix-turn-helix domain-containing protein [Marinilongibacter aquaticus]